MTEPIFAKMYGCGGAVDSIASWEHIDLPAVQPLPCFSRSCEGREGYGHLVYRYNWSVGHYAA